MNFGLRQETIKRINDVFAGYPLIERVVLYGSRAKGDYQNGSDIDLALVGQGLDISIQARIRCELDDLLLPYTLDISILDQIGNPDLLEHIRRVGITFYDRESH